MDKPRIFSSYTDDSEQILDSLTGAFSRNQFDKQLPDELKRSARYGISLSLCMIDIDYFKSINDTYGHKRGDQVLYTLVEKIKEATKNSCLIFRYGGDEFIVLMTDTDKEQALKLANSILHKVNETLFIGEPPLNISLSIGVSSYPQDASTPEELFNDADSCLYEAKKRGRGQVIDNSFLDKKFQVENLHFDKISRLIERDEAFSKLHNFLERLSYEKRGVMRINGIKGSGRTCFLNRVVSYAKIYNYEVISLIAQPRLKIAPYGVFLDSSEDFRTDTDKFGIEYFEEYIIRKMKDNNKVGFLIALDNISNVDHSTLSLIRQLITGEIQYNIGVVYSTEPEGTRSFDYIDVPVYDNISLKALSPDGMKIWIRSVLAWEPPQVFIEWLYEQTDGLPKLIRNGIVRLLDKGILKYSDKQEWIIEKNYSNTILNDKIIKSDRIPRNNLPAELTEFIGRQNEISKISSLLEHTRLVTLLGPGGIGKTRLSLKVASKIINNYKDGVFFVSLASITQQEMLIASIAKVLNIVEISGQRIYDSLKSALYDKRCLLILDNFEQLMHEALIVNDILASTPNLSVIVTSREALRITGEQIFNVQPLEFSEPDQKVSIDELGRQPAIALFVSRAKANLYNFEFTKENARAVAEICARLDGIPLAIELAAANISYITLDEMLSQSRNRLKWLNNGPRDLPERHRTLRNTIEWGYSLLTEEEQKLFIRLGVFAGRFDLSAAESIVNIENNNNGALLSRLFPLINKSLLRKAPGYEKGEEKHFYMLETIHEYAQDLFKNSEDENLIRNRHADYYLSLALQSQENINGPEQQKWMNLLEYAHSNILTAMDFFMSTGNIENEIRLAGSLGYFWETRGYWSEGVDRIESIVKRYDVNTGSKYIVKVYEWYGRLLHLQDEYDEAIAALKVGLELSKKSGDRLEEADILYKLAWAVSMLANPRGQQELFEKSLSIYREVSSERGIAVTLQDLSLVYYYDGKYDLAEECSNESLEICTQLGDELGIARSLGRLGAVARGKGDFDKAKILLEKYLRGCEELDDKVGIAQALITLAELVRSQEDYELSEEYYEKCLNLGRELGYKSIIARSLKDLGEIARYKGDFSKANELYQGSLAVLKETGEIGEVMWLYRNMAEMEMKKGDRLKAKEYYLKGLKIYKDKNQNTPLYALLVFIGLAGVAEKEDKLARAVQLFGAADRLFENIGKLVAKGDIIEYERRLSLIQNKLNSSDFDKAWNEGKAMDIKQAVNYAVEDN